MNASPLYVLHNAAATIAAFHAAVRLGILDRIDREPATVEQIADSCGTSRRGTTLLIAALSACGLVAQVDSGRYEATSAGLAALHPVLDIWRHLPESVRSGAPMLHADRASGSATLYPQVVPHLARMSEAAARRAAALLPPAIDILDVGCGAAPWSLALAARDKECRVSAVDLPEVLPMTRHAVEQARRGEQYVYLCGDVFDIELPPRAYDLILLANLCHLFDEDANRRLLRRLTPCLHAAGTLAILDFIPTASSDSMFALYELGLFLRTGTGQVHPLAAYQEWLADIGLPAAAAVEISEDPPITLLTTRAHPTRADSAVSQSGLSRPANT